MPAKKKRSASPNKQLIESSIKLQNALADNLIVMNKLIKQQSEMIEIFREASKHVNDLEVKDESLRPLIKRLDDLLNQNRTLAKGLVMLEQYVKTNQPIRQF